MRRIWLVLLATLVALTACKKSEDNGASSAGDIIIRPVGDTMEYETKEFRVRSGSQVKITFENTATSPAMQHNVVILKAGADVDEIGMAAIEAGEAADYIPESDQILAHTGLAKPGETTTVEFTAPEPGEYVYICTFPGHFATMRGKIIVE